MDEVRTIKYDYHIILKSGAVVDGHIVAECLAKAMDMILNGNPCIFENEDNAIFFNKDEIAYVYINKNKYEDYIDIFDRCSGPIEQSGLNSELLSFEKNFRNSVFRKRKESRYKTLVYQK